MSKREKMDEMKKMKLIYSGELLFFAGLFVVLGSLILAGVIAIREWKRIAFTYITLVGGVILIGDCVWALCSQKRRKKISLVDKVLVVPASLGVMGFDIYALAVNLTDEKIFGIVIFIDFVYLAAVYVFEAFYHYRYPVPGLIDDEKPAASETPDGVKAAAPEERIGNSDSSENSDHSGK